jgi:hypothetical protein
LPVHHDTGMLGEGHLALKCRLNLPLHPALGVVGYGDRRTRPTPRQGDGSLDRWLRATLVALVIALMGATGAAAPVAAAARVPRVAVILGPVGSLTNTFRTSADEAVAAARAAGAEVVTVYTPNATWPAVKRAVTGASIVVYLGHGNGWPSRYRDALFPPTQNGFGLNPRAGGNDYDHQYFGEASIARLQLAPNAVVVLSHLCYASGNTEPGLAEGTPDQAVQRVDNYAAGFLRAGARAVVAEAYLGPAYYVKSILRGAGSIESIWSRSPTVNGRHAIVAGSERTPGYKVHLDPDRATSGFVRSLVSRGLTSAEVRAGATGTGAGTGTGGVIGPPPEPSLASAGIKFGQPAFSTLPIAATGTKLTLPLASGRATRIPAGAQVSVRWDPILLDAPPAPEPTTAPTPEPTVAPTPEPTPTVVPEPTVDPNVINRFERPNAPTLPPAATPSPEPVPTRTPAPTPTPAPVAPPVDLVVPEQEGTVVTPAKAIRGARGLSLVVTYPAVPGLYRLTAMLHTPEGVAYDDATQAMLTPLLVRVGGSRAVAYGAPTTLVATAGRPSEIPVRVLNAGAVRWDQVVTAAPNRIAGESGLELRTTTLPAHLVATWVAGDGTPVPVPVSTRLDDAVFAPGGASEVLLALQAPDVAGSYLLLLDVLTPESGPMSALGSAPAIIRVTVNAAAPTAPPAASPTQAAAPPVKAVPTAAPTVAPTMAPAPTPAIPVRQGDN